MSFRDVLRDELQRRRARNARYSLRAFASALAVDHSSLSQILRGKRRLTQRTIRRVGAALRLSAREIDFYCGEENDAALLQVVSAPLFRADSRWLASILGIRIDEVNVSLQRLVRLRALRMTASGRWEVEDGQPGGAVADRRA